MNHHPPPPDLGLYFMAGFYVCGSILGLTMRPLVARMLAAALHIIDREQARRLFVAIISITIFVFISLKFAQEFIEYGNADREQLWSYVWIAAFLTGVAHFTARSFNSLTTAKDRTAWISSSSTEMETQPLPSRSSISKP